VRDIFYLCVCVCVGGGPLFRSPAPVQGFGGKKGAGGGVWSGATRVGFHTTKGVHEQSKGHKLTYVAQEVAHQGGFK